MPFGNMPVDVLLHFLYYLEFPDIFSLGSGSKNLAETVPRTRSALKTWLGIDPENAMWVFQDGRYAPFEGLRAEVRGISGIQGSQGSQKNEYVLEVGGRRYHPSSSCKGWVHTRQVCHSPSEYHRLFRVQATPDMVPRVICDTDGAITYLGLRRTQKIDFERGRKVDVMDSTGYWWNGRMEAMREDSILYHFDGWDKKWDQWYPVDTLHVAPLHSIVKDWKCRLSVGDRLDFKKTTNQHWFTGSVLEREEGCVKVRNEEHVTHEEEWVEWESERVMFAGAHTYPSRLIENPVWRDVAGTNVFLYRRKGFHMLVDHVLSETEKMLLCDGHERK